MEERKFHEAKQAGLPRVTVWGSGTPLREFLHVDDLAAGAVFCLDHYDEYEHINCGAGTELTVAELATTIKDIVGFAGELVFDSTKPDGTPRKQPVAGFGLGAGDSLAQRHKKHLRVVLGSSGTGGESGVGSDQERSFAICFGLAA